MKRTIIINDYNRYLFGMSKKTSKLQKYEYVYEIANSKAETIANIQWIQLL